MAYQLPYFVQWGPTQSDGYNITASYSVDKKELYLQNPQALGFFKYIYSGSDYETMTVTGISLASPGRKAGMLQNNGIVMFSYCSITAVSDVDGHVSTTGSVPVAWFSPQGNRSGSFSTNVPIFHYSDQQYMDDYLNNNLPEADRLEALTHAMNYGQVENTQDTEDYYIFNTFETANISLGVITYTGQAPTGRFEIFKANKEPVLYYVDKENSTQLALIAPQVVGSVYSSVNKQDVINKQDDAGQWSVGSLTYTGPWYHTLEYLPDGDYTVGVTWDTNILIFKDQADAEGYLNGLVPAEDADNWGSIGKPQIATNETGTKELITDFGGNYSENVFSHDYLMSRTELADVGGKFFDTNILTALLDGLKLYGNNPMDSVLSCLYFPFDLSTICTSTSVTDIYFGSYKMENVSAKKVSNRSGYKELGTTFIKPTFYNWLDYEAMHIYLYLPYIGFVELDVSKYLNKYLKIIYMVDIHSGECEVSLCADGLLMDTYSGQIGIKQPVTYQDLATYFQSQITALRNGVMSSVGLPVGSAAAGAGIGSQAGPYGAAAGAIAGSAITAPFVAPNAVYQGLKVANYKPPLFSKGGYSSEIGANMPQYAFLVFMYNDIQEPDNLVDIFGKPSNESGTVGSFSGFLSVSSVNLQCSNATDAEKSEIVSLLHNGIYI